MIFNQDRYYRFQSYLRDNKHARWFWSFLALYALSYIFLVGLFIFSDAVGRKVVLLGIIAFILTWPFVAWIINFIYKKERPYQRYGFIPVASTQFFSNVHPHRYNSFPSRHTMALAAVNTVIFFFYPVIGGIGLIIAACVGIARIILGYHYPADVIFGYILGVLSGLVVLYFVAPLLFTI